MSNKRHKNLKHFSGEEKEEGGDDMRNMKNTLSQVDSDTRARPRALLNSPGKVAASEQASVTHSSKNKPGSCENEAWEL